MQAQKILFLLHSEWAANSDTLVTNTRHVLILQLLEYVFLTRTASVLQLLFHTMTEATLMNAEYHEAIL